MTSPAVWDLIREKLEQYLDSHPDVLDEFVNHHYYHEPPDTHSDQPEQGPGRLRRHEE